MRIGEAARAAGLTPRALRYYEQQGLVTPHRTPSGHREYEPWDVTRLHAVRRLLHSGLTIADVRGVAHLLDPCDGSPAAPDSRDQPGEPHTTPASEEPSSCEVADVSRRRLAELDARISELTTLRNRLAGELSDRFHELYAPLTPGHG